MPTSLLNLPGELRNEVYKYVLVSDEPLPPWHAENDLAVNILATNKAIRQEATWLLYHKNCIDLTILSPRYLTNFLSVIGPENANDIRQISISLPRGVNRGLVGRLWKKPALLDGLAQACKKLRTLIIHWEPQRAQRFYLHRTCLIWGFSALDLIDTRFRAIPSLQEIIVEVAGDGLSEKARKRMEKLGWIISKGEDQEAREIRKMEGYYKWAGTFGCRHCDFSAESYVDGDSASGKKSCIFCENVPSTVRF